MVNYEINYCNPVVSLVPTFRELIEEIAAFEEREFSSVKSSSQVNTKLVCYRMITSHIV